MRLQFRQEENNEEEQWVYVPKRTRGCATPFAKTNSLLGESLLPQSLAGDVKQEQKQEEKPVEQLWGNYRGRRYRILEIEGETATIQTPNLNKTMSVALSQLSDVGTHRESKAEIVCYVCGLPWSVCVVGGRDRNGVPFGPDNPGP